ncbi:unnamed protein product [Moneuplotes crassus]|uniref:RING-type domain-containing protein n=1 Tax=Euplotes crassus TaxID=5936 RepID=A0AAD1US23_EUPCR|nr:unnamed protein product [Moneuplotes crassus]
MMIITDYQYDEQDTCELICYWSFSIFFIFTPSGLPIYFISREENQYFWTKEAQFITICLFSIPFLALYIPLPIVFDESKDAGFWIGYSLMIYLSIYCHLFYFQEGCMFKIEWITYLSPATWIVALGFFIWEVKSCITETCCEKCCETSESLSREQADRILQLELQLQEQERTIQRLQTMNSRFIRGNPYAEDFVNYADSESHIDPIFMSRENNESVFPIDLEPFNDGRRVKRCNKCRNMMHKDCFDEWFQHHESCPICRSLL